MSSDKEVGDRSCLDLKSIVKKRYWKDMKANILFLVLDGTPPDAEMGAENDISSTTTCKQTDNVRDEHQTPSAAPKVVTTVPRKTMIPMSAATPQIRAVKEVGLARSKHHLLNHQQNFEEITDHS